MQLQSDRVVGQLEVELLHKLPSPEPLSAGALRASTHSLTHRELSQLRHSSSHLYLQTIDTRTSQPTSPTAPNQQQPIDQNPNPRIQHHLSPPHPRNQTKQHQKKWQQQPSAAPPSAAPQHPSPWASQQASSSPTASTSANPCDSMPCQPRGPIPPRRAASSRSRTTGWTRS